MIQIKSKIVDYTKSFPSFFVCKGATTDAEEEAVKDAISYATLRAARCIVVSNGTCINEETNASYAPCKNCISYNESNNLKHYIPMKAYRLVCCSEVIQNDLAGLEILCRLVGLLSLYQKHKTYFSLMKTVE